MKENMHLTLSSVEDMPGNKVSSCMSSWEDARTQWVKKIKIEQDKVIGQYMREHIGTY